MATHTLDFEPNICCEICSECYACDFDCPACGKQTRVWGDVCDQVNDKISCESCKAEFVIDSCYPFILSDAE